MRNIIRWGFYLLTAYSMYRFMGAAIDASPTVHHTTGGPSRFVWLGLTGIFAAIAILLEAHHQRRQPGD
jgi:hypothetical protein